MVQARFARLLTVSRLITIGPLLLILVMAALPGWVRYSDEVESAVTVNRDMARVGVQPMLTLLTLSVAGGNYANVLTPEARDLFKANERLLYFRGEGKTDGGEPWGVAYDRKSGKVHRTVYNAGDIDGLDEKLSRGVGALESLPADAPQRAKIEKIIEQIKAEKSAMKSDAEAVRALEQTFVRPSQADLASGWMIDSRSKQMHMTLPLEIRNGGTLWMVFDVSQLDQVGARVFARVAPLTLGLLVVGWIAALVLARSIVRPLNAMTGAMRELAGGNMAVEVPALGRSDEIGAMAAALAVFKENAQETERLVKQVINSARQVASATSQASSAVGQVSDGAHTQLSALRGVAKSVQQSSDAIAEVGRGTQSASELSRSMAERVSEGRERMRDVVTAVKGTAENTGRVEKMAAAISRIADQTNMLALNAAIEAARAGEHGKGFAVVADEVRKLAENSGELAEEIGDLVRAATGDSDRAVAVVEVVRSHMEGIVDTVHRNDALTAAVATSMEQQQATLVDISHNVTNLTQIAQSNAAAAEEITATMVDLSRLADQSRNQVERFNRSGSRAGEAKSGPAEAMPYAPATA